MADTTQIDGEVTTFAYTLLNDATAADARTTLGLVIGTDVQAEDAALTSIAGLATAANTLIYTTALDTYAVIASANSSLLVTSGTGVPSLSTAIPDGVTATTQSASDNSTKVATTAYVDSAVGGGGGGGLVYLGSATASASATVDLDNLLSATYDNYVVMVNDLLPATNSVNLHMRIGTGATPTYQTTTYIDGLSNTTHFEPFVRADRSAYALSNTSGRETALTVNVSNANGGGDKSFYAIGNPNIATLPGCISYGSWQTATVITSIRFYMSSGNIATGEFRVYGIANS